MDIGDLVRHSVGYIRARRRARVGAHHYSTIVLYRHDSCLAVENVCMEAQ